MSTNMHPISSSHTAKSAGTLRNSRHRTTLQVLVLTLCATPAFGAGPNVGGCTMFPGDNYWNTPVVNAPIHPQSSDFVAAIGAAATVHPDFGTVWAGAPNGIPYVVVPQDQATVDMGADDFTYWDESDPGGYPIPADPPIEGGADGTGDRHVLIVRQGECRLYELYAAYPRGDGTWTAGSGAIFDLNGNNLRPNSWTSADAAGLPILPGLVRYEEVMSGEIRHAIRFTAAQVYSGYTWPARHSDGRSSSTSNPPMGQRFRLKASVDISGFSPEVQVILQALKIYGLVLADTGGNWYISGVPNMNWNDDHLHELVQLTGTDFEAVDMSSYMVDPDSAQSRSWLDLNRDDVVDSGDLGVLMSSWGSCSGCMADLNADGTVGSDDLSVLLENY
jgi:hypothetical protein